MREINIIDSGYVLSFSVEQLYCYLVEDQAKKVYIRIVC